MGTVLLAASVNPLTVREFVGVTEMSKTLCHYEDGCISLYEKLLNCTLKMGNFMVLNDTFINLKKKNQLGGGIDKTSLAI